jgi:PAS domain S-box-containing protein
MFWTTDAHGRLTYLSRRWYDHTGRDPLEDLGEGWLAALHPDDAAATRASFLRASSRGLPFSLDYRLRGANGLYRWVIGAGAPRVDADGAPAGFVGTVIDVHERKLLQDRFERVTQAAGIGVWYADHPFDSMQPNPQLRAQFALPDEAPVSMAQFYARVHADDRAGLTAALAQALVDGAGHDAEFRVGDGAAAHPGTPARWIRSIGWADRGEQGAAMQFDGVTLDITSHKQAEEVLRRMANELADANRRQAEFLVTLAHELRNPLAPISNGLETLRLAPDSPHREKTRDMMARQVRHLVRLIDDLLDVARIARGKEVLKRAPVLLADVVNSAVEISTPLIEAGRHRLTVELPPAPLLLDIDAHRIAQVVGNLLNNAAKYTPAGGDIALRARVDDDALHMEISDNGIGIPLDAQATVFELFAQVPGNRAHAQGGLGIGLNLVRRLVELHGGSVAVHSDGAGLGSTFTLRLPLPGAGTEPAALEGAVGAGGPALRILLVDDNIDAVDSMSALLENRGHAVAAAYDGATALLMAPAFQPDVIFLDIGLPGISGLEVARRIRAVPELDGVGLVAVTGWASEGDRQRSRDAGFDFHLSKPASLQAIDEVLRALAPPG